MPLSPPPLAQTLPPPQSQKDFPVVAVQAVEFMEPEVQLVILPACMVPMVLLGVEQRAEQVGGATVVTVAMDIRRLVIFHSPTKQKGKTWIRKKTPFCVKSLYILLILRSFLFFPRPRRSCT